MAWLTNYGYRRKITIDHAKVDSTLTDYPMLVKLYYDSSKSAWTTPHTYSVGDIVKNDGSYYKCLTASTSKEPGTTTDWQDDWQFLGYEFDFTKVLSSGYDFRFTASDETTLRSHERAEFTKASEPYSAQFFVLIPSVSSSAATDIYMYYGYSSATDASAPTTVWADYELVSHMSATLSDVTGNHTLTNDGSDVVDSMNGKGRSFDGSTEMIDTNYYPASISAVVLTAIVQYSAFASSNSMATMGCHDNASKRFYLGTYYSSGHTHSFAIGSRYLSGSDASGMDDGAFHHQYGRAVSGNAYYYVDGVSGCTSNTFSFSGTSADSFHIGGRTFDGTATPTFPGIIDEVRIKESAESVDWAEVEYADLVRHDLHSIGTEEAASQTITGAAVLTGTGSLSADSLVEVVGAAALAGSASMSAVALVIVVAAAELVGTGDLQASAFLELAGAILFEGEGDLSANGLIEVPGQVSMDGAGDLSADALVEVMGAAVLDGAGDLSATGAVQPSTPVLSGEYSVGCINLSW